MSFIHEALKRSDRARRLLGASRLEPADAALAPPRRSRWLPWIIVLLFANLGLLAWFVWEAPAPEVPATASSPPPPAGEVRSLEREAGGTEPSASPLSGVDAASGATSDADAVALDALPAGLRAGLPSLHIDAHVWSEDPAQRFAVIDLKRRVVGDALGGGATLVEITADGVVIEVGGRRVSIARQ